MKTTILFDLDGTLMDTATGVFKSVRYAADKQNITLPDNLDFIIGPPLMDTFINAFHMPQQSAEQAYQDYSERYAEKGMYETNVFEGVKEMLSELKKQGKKLAVTTSKSQNFAQKMIEHFGLNEYFDIISGNRLGQKDSATNSKAKVVRYALEQLHESPEHSVLVGDRKYDILGGKEVGIPVIGVLYGYGTLQELQQYGADSIAKTPQDVVTILSNWDKGH